MSHFASVDIGTVRGLIAAVLFISFAALWARTFSPRRRAEFDQVSRLPLEEDVGGGGNS